MLRSFLTRVVTSLTRVVLLVLCLLICLACATPFPVESLEEGMTDESVREKFGAPEATNRQWDTSNGPAVLTGVSWTYVHEERAWLETVFWSMVLPHCILLSPLTKVIGEGCTPFHRGFRDNTINEIPVILHFEEEKLVRWEVLPQMRGISASGYDPAIDPLHRDLGQEMRQMQRVQDIKHHNRGHTHHHGHK